MAKMWAGRTDGLTDSLADDFNSSIGFDSRMYKQDITGSMAHAAMLAACNIITSEEADTIIGGLEGILCDLESGALEIDMNASFLINDGQHRKAAIDAAIAEDESLREETISIVLYRDQGLQRSQQMFTDLNKHAVTTSKSLNTLYESKDPVALLTKKTIDAIPFLRKYTDKEKDNLSKYSSNIFTLNTFYEANKRIYKAIKDSQKAERMIHSYWKNVVINMREWNEMNNGELSKKSLREDYITTQGLIILALGRLGEFYCTSPDVNIEKSLKGLRKIDWLRNNEECWMNRAIKPNGKINRNEQGIFLTYIQIARVCLFCPCAKNNPDSEKIFSISS